MSIFGNLYAVPVIPVAPVAPVVLLHEALKRWTHLYVNY